jgi:hypothetical protein
LIRPTLTLLVLSGALLVAMAGCGAGSSSGVSPTASPAMADSSCQLEAQSKSLNSDHATSFTITNKTSTTLTVFWLDFSGARVKYFDLPPGATHDQGTYLTHPWVVADTAGTCVRLFLVTTPSHITIG